MKRLCYCLLFVFLINLMPAQGNSATAQPEAIVPPEVEQKFTLEYPEVSARWKIADGLYKAMFINPRNNMGYIIVYDENANIIRREKELEMQGTARLLEAHPELCDEWISHIEACRRDEAA